MHVVHPFRGLHLITKQRFFSMGLELSKTEGEQKCSVCVLSHLKMRKKVL